MTEERKLCPFSLSAYSGAHVCVKEGCMAWQPEHEIQKEVAAPWGTNPEDVPGRVFKTVTVPAHCRLIP